MEGIACARQVPPPHGQAQPAARDALDQRVQRRRDFAQAMRQRSVLVRAVAGAWRTLAQKRLAALAPAPLASTKRRADGVPPALRLETEELCWLARQAQLKSLALVYQGA